MTALTETDWGRIFAKAWSDPDFRAAYEDDPRAALTKYADALDIAPDAKFTFPTMPSGMSEDDAKSVAEGSSKPESMYCC